MVTIACLTLIYVWVDQLWEGPLWYQIGMVLVA